MEDSLHREINYLRISVTDRCNMRCVYCMPACGVPEMTHGDMLTYEEIIRLTKLFAKLGITKIRLTGGEPLVRKDLPFLVRELKQIQGIEQVCMTTNGLALKQQLAPLVAAGLDGVNISLDALDEEVFGKITRVGGVAQVLEAIDLAAAAGLQVKVNAVATTLNQDHMIHLTAYFLNKKNIPLRFIELMPIGEGKQYQGYSQTELLEVLTKAFGPMEPVKQRQGGQNCSYYTAQGYGGQVGFISPMSHKFCHQCNRVRLTADGHLKTCLQFDSELSLKALLDQGDEALLAKIKEVIGKKHWEHQGWKMTGLVDSRSMVKIGG